MKISEYNARIARLKALERAAAKEPPKKAPEPPKVAPQKAESPKKESGINSLLDGFEEKKSDAEKLGIKK